MADLIVLLRFFIRVEQQITRLQCDSVHIERFQCTVVFKIVCLVRGIHIVVVCIPASKRILAGAVGNKAPGQSFVFILHISAALIPDTGNTRLDKLAAYNGRMTVCIGRIGRKQADGRFIYQMVIRVICDIEEAFCDLYQRTDSVRIISSGTISVSGFSLRTRRTLGARFACGAISDLEGTLRSICQIYGNNVDAAILGRCGSLHYGCDADNRYITSITTAGRSTRTASSMNFNLNSQVHFRLVFQASKGDGTIAGFTLGDIAECFDLFQCCFRIISQNQSDMRGTGASAVYTGHRNCLGVRCTISGPVFDHQGFNDCCVSQTVHIILIGCMGTFRRVRHIQRSGHGVTGFLNRGILGIFRSRLGIFCSSLCVVGCCLSLISCTLCAVGCCLGIIGRSLCIADLIDKVLSTFHIVRHLGICLIPVGSWRNHSGHIT